MIQCDFFFFKCMFCTVLFWAYRLQWECMKHACAVHAFLVFFSFGLKFNLFRLTVMSQQILLVNGKNKNV